ncbi:MAG TPA: 2-oxo acid dehydrogenase subunit E2 [Rubrobacteraceae bacterium]|nr:2-oxo acid dehydrogenase subunit E2 [Rubrobacteraceae bacterium]
MSQDVERVLEGTTRPLPRMRRTAAKRLTEAWTAPVIHLAREVDMTRMLKARDQEKGVTVTDVLLHACARALTRHPDINAHFADETVTTFEKVNLGFAVATDAGLTVPVIHDADSLDLAQMAERRHEAVQKARGGALRVRDVDGGTFTVSNLGMFGVDHFDAILNPPQVGILAVGATRQRYMMVDGEPAWRPISELTLTCDHRGVDGVTGARFLSTLCGLIEGTDDEST